MSNFTNPWTPTVLNRLGYLLQHRPMHSYTEIADTLAREFSASFTKSATIAKARRTGLAQKHRPEDGRGRPQTPVKDRVAPVPVLPPRRPKREHGRVSIYNLRTCDCHWPEGDRAPYLFCGKPVLEGLSWCGEHARRAFTTRYYTGKT